MYENSCSVVRITIGRAVDSQEDKIVFVVMTEIVLVPGDIVLDTHVILVDARGAKKYKELRELVCCLT